MNTKELIEKIFEDGVGEHITTDLSHDRIVASFDHEELGWDTYVRKIVEWDSETDTDIILYQATDPQDSETFDKLDDATNWCVESLEHALSTALDTLSE